MNVKYVYFVKIMLKINPNYPMRYEYFKLIHSRPKKRKMLNIIKLKCKNYPE